MKMCPFVMLDTVPCDEIEVAGRNITRTYLETSLISVDSSAVNIHSHDVDRALLFSVCIRVYVGDFLRRCTLI